MCPDRFEDALLSLYRDYFWLVMLGSSSTHQNMTFFNHNFVNAFFILQWSSNCTYIETMSRGEKTETLSAI